MHLSAAYRAAYRAGNSLEQYDLPRPANFPIAGDIWPLSLLFSTPNSAGQEAIHEKTLTIPNAIQDHSHP
jgi:hypothetical protein